MLAGGRYERTSGAAGQSLGSYRRRAPERTVLHELVAGHAQTLLADLRDADPEGGGLPRYVERELAAYLRCGILAHGFARLVLARDPAWTSWIGGLVVRAIGAWQRRVARKRGIRTPLTGAVTFVQQFGGLVNLNVHFHLVVPDGVFASDGEGLRFEMLPVPTNANVLAILDRIIDRTASRR